MRKCVGLLLGVLSLSTAWAAEPFTPTVWADIPDVAPLRVGDTYYMVSTTMHFNPGIPVMASKDLVNWKTISYCYDTIEDRDADRLDNGKDDYGQGTWASSIRFNEADGYFYVSSFNNRARHTYLFRTKDPAGKWDHVMTLNQLIYDHSLWIENGKFYFFATDRKCGVVRHTLKPDFSGVESETKCVCHAISRNIGGGLGEGTQIFKRGEYYYLVNICWRKPRCRLVNVHRAKTLDGPFDEVHIALEHEGIAQGSFITKPDGSWVAVLFGDRGGVGRVPFVLDVEWKDGWPTVKKENPYAADLTKVPSVVASDTFEAGKLDLAWQWNHNPDNANWALTNGTLDITTSRVDDNLLRVKNQLTQRTFGPTSVAEVKVDGRNLKVGDKAGLSLFQHHWHAISLQKTEKGYDIVLDQTPLATCDRHTLRPAKTAAREVLRRPAGTNGVVYLKAVCDFTPWANPRYTEIPDHEDAGRFYYSLDGKTWEALGEAVYLPYTIPHFTGYRFGLFNWATKEAGGTASFDDYTVRYATEGETLKMDGSNPIVKTRFTADPAAVVDGEWLYLFMGHDDAGARGYRMYDWSVARTKNLVDWEDFGAVMSVRETFPWAKPDKAWASQAIKRGDKWYWYVAISPKGRGEDTIGIAVADKPEGPWKDALGHGLVSGRGYIDPSVFIDDDGKAYLFWGNCGGNPGCWYAELKHNMIELAGEVKEVPGLMDAKAFGAPLKKRHGAGAYKPIDTNFEEAPWLYKIGDTYYLEYAAGGVPENWSYSTAKSIHGPWEYKGKIMDNAGGTGTIHGGSVKFKGQWLMVYHDGNLPGGGDCRRSVRIEPYTRNADGSIPFITPTREGVRAMTARGVSVTVDTEAKGFAVPQSLWGIFFEDINWGADGGLNPELLANPGFDWVCQDIEKWNFRHNGWQGDFRDGGMARLSIQMGRPVHPNTARHLRIESFGAGRAGVKNRGLDGMWVKDGEPYRLTFDWREVKKEKGAIDYTLGDWKRETIGCTAPLGQLVARDGFEMVVEPEKDGRSTFSILVKGRRVFEFDNVRLAPTGPNLVRAGLRKDLVDILADLKPAFVRFPGGCIVEEGDFQHWYDWRRTVGPKERRECILNRWTRPNEPYYQTHAVGFYEYFLLCEELGAEPLPICLSGLTCQYQKPPELCAVEDADYFADVISELIEFANGDVTTTWGKVRAEMGHPAPFNLKMVGIGNENWDAAFFDRCEPIAKIIRRRHPDIKIVGSSGPGVDDGHHRYAWGRLTKETADIVDEHYYRDPKWFLRNARRYDVYDRSRGLDVYAGEYACHHKIGRDKPNTQHSAVCEAAAMTGFERNADLVKMASYAPLFAREGHSQWAPNLIWFDGTTSWRTPNYYVQQLFSLYRPDTELPIALSDETDLYACAGRRGTETIVKLVNSAAEEKRVTLNLKGKAKVITLAGENAAVNTREATAVRPREETREITDAIKLPANSLTILVF